MTASLLNRALTAAAWGYAGTALKLVLQLGAQILLARLLGPGEYGVFAIAVIVVSFALYFGDVGSSALIPRKEISDDEIRFAFTWQFIVSSLVTVLIAASAAPLATFFDEPRAANAIQAVGFICILNAIGGVSLALLRRKIDFKTIQIAQVTGYFAGYILVGIPYALLIEPSVTALVIAWMVQVAVTSAMYCRAAPHSWLPKFATPSGRELVSFGVHSFLANIGTWVLTNADKVVVARVFPTAQLGLYSTAANLMSTPLSLINSTFQQVVFSVSSRSTGQLDIGRTFAFLTVFVVIFAGLAFGFCLATADTIVMLLYGEQWIAAAPLLQAFSASMFFHSVAGVVSPLLWSQKSIFKDAALQVASAAAIVFFSILMSEYSFLVVAWSVTFVYGARAIILVFIGALQFLQDKSLLITPLIFSSIFVILSSILFGVIDQFLQKTGIPRISSFIINIVVMIWVVYVAFRTRRIFGIDFSEAIDKLTHKVQHKLKKNNHKDDA
jgi:O-antigen/teichoic acid export membrane protein